MNNSKDLIQVDPLEARYVAFLETIALLRPHLHRYCARMTGSLLDGEDVVQEALFEAHRKLDKFDESRSLKAPRRNKSGVRSELYDGNESGRSRLRRLNSCRQSTAPNPAV